MKALELKFPPALLSAVTAALMWLTAAGFPALNRVHGWQTELALLLFIAGIVLALYAVREFRRHSTTVHPMKPQDSSDLVTGGVYSASRNPMYLGLLLILLSWSVLLGNVMATAWLFVYVLYMNQFQILPEERVLEEQFGEDYRNYRKRVRRWI